jgi:hypothetical protein
MLEYKGYKVAGGSIKRERRTKNKKFPPRRTTKQDRATEKREGMTCSPLREGPIAKGEGGSASAQGNPSGITSREAFK